MSFDEQPDGDPHGECAAEISRLQTLAREAYEVLVAGAALGVTTAAGSLSTNIPLAGTVQALATPAGAPQPVAQLTGSAIAWDKDMDFGR